MGTFKRIAGVAGFTAIAGLGLAISGQASSPQAPVAALAKGNPVSDAAKPAWLLEGFGELRPDASKARSVKSAGGTAWVLLPAADGGACYVVNGAGGCDRAAGVKDGALSVTTIAMPSEDEIRRQGAARRALEARGVKGGDVKSNVRTKATRRGVVTDDIASVRSLDAKGGVIDEAKVLNNVYDLELGLEGDAVAVQFLHADGSVANERPAF